MISLSIRSELESLPTLLKKLESKERIEILIKLMAYLVPKANTDNDGPVHAKQNIFYSRQRLHKVIIEKSDDHQD